MFTKYVKLSQDEWNEVETLVNDKNDEITSLKQMINDLKEDVKALSKVKENDELMYSLEQDNESLRKQNLFMRKELLSSREDLKKINVELDSQLALEKT